MSYTAARAVHLYFSAKAVIVAPMHVNHAGIYFEQAEVRFFTNADSKQLGAAFREAYERFSVSDAPLQGRNKTEWPAFLASGMRSVREFEKAYRPVQCLAVNLSNTIVRASVAHPARPNVEISTSFNPLLSFEVVGEHLLQVVAAAAAAAADADAT